jgi:ABC-type Co2+ transport system permease subunit
MRSNHRLLFAGIDAALAVTIGLAVQAANFQTFLGLSKLLWQAFCCGFAGSLAGWALYIAIRQRIRGW